MQDSPHRLRSFLPDPSRKNFVITPRLDFQRGKVEKCCICDSAGFGEEWTKVGKAWKCGVCSRGGQ